VRLFRRSATIQVGTIKVVSRVDDGGIRGLDVAFRIERTAKPQPNKAEIQIWNLNPEHRGELQKLTDVFVAVQAGYGGEESLIFAGDLTEVSVVRDGEDLVTQIASGDGEKAHRTGRVSASFGKNAAVGDVIKSVGRKLYEQLKGSPGDNVFEKAANVSLEGVAGVFSEGVTVHGNTAREFDRLTKSAGLEYSIQSGKIVLTKRGKARTQTTALVLSFDSGLLSAPERSSDGIVKARALMIPGLEPPELVRFDTDGVRGFFRIEKATYTGNTASAEWFVDLECKEI
jgi:hypothetical protein